MAYPPPVYGDGPRKALQVDIAFYQSVASDIKGREPIEAFVVPIRSGRAWAVPAGHVCRIITIEGPQAGDLNLWNYHNPRERFWAARTRQLQRAHVSTHDRLWSTLPYLRPMATVTTDSLDYYGVDEDGGRIHDLLGTRCDPYANKLLTGEDFDYHCHSNLVRAVIPYGLTEYDVHDVLNLFMCTGLNDADQYFAKACPSKAGDFFEFFAEIDLLCALSTCPGGDLSLKFWGAAAEDAVTVCRPLGVEVFEVSPLALDGWVSPKPAGYHGSHGLQTESVSVNDPGVSQGRSEVKLSQRGESSTAHGDGR